MARDPFKGRVLALPQEVYDEIYELTFQALDDLVPKVDVSYGFRPVLVDCKFRLPTKFHINKTCRAELAWFLASSCFEFYNGLYMLKWLMSLGDTHRRKIKHTPILFLLNNTDRRARMTEASPHPPYLDPHDFRMYKQMTKKMGMDTGVDIRELRVPMGTYPLDAAKREIPVAENLFKSWCKEQNQTI